MTKLKGKKYCKATVFTCLKVIHITIMTVQLCLRVPWMGPWFGMVRKYRRIQLMNRPGLLGGYTWACQNPLDFCHRKGRAWQLNDVSSLPPTLFCRSSPPSALKRRCVCQWQHSLPTTGAGHSGLLLQGHKTRDTESVPLGSTGVTAGVEVKLGGTEVSRVC